MNLTVSGFQWDAGNRTKCRKHGVTIVEIESLFRGTVAVVPDPRHSATEGRFKAIGSSATGRSVLVVFTLRQASHGTLIRPISARHMHKKEIEHYEAEVANAGQ